MDSEISEQVKTSFGSAGVDLPLDQESIFSNHKNVYKKRIEKRQTKLLEKISAIKHFFDEDEKIMLVTTGCSPTSLGEQFLTGWIYMYLKRAIFVFTNKRILHIPTTHKYGYRHSVARVLYDDIQSIKMSGGKLVIKYANGKKDIFLHILRKDRKKIKSYLKTISLNAQPGEGKARVHLCPRCTHELVAGDYVCPNCRLEFKNKAEGRRLAIIFPGGGYFYTRHPFIGIGDAIGEAILLFLLVMALIEVFKKTPESGFNLVVIAIVLSIEKIVSIYHSNHYLKEFIPVDKEVQPQVQ